ncbi:MAG: hypothetical protein AABZ60_17470 [Planctomycetota bacterium]
MIWNSFKKVFLLFGSVLALGSVFLIPPSSENLSLPRIPEEWAHSFSQRWKNEQIHQLFPLFSNEVYLALTDEHQNFSQYQTIALLQKYFDHIRIQEMVLEKVHPKYLLFRQTSFRNGKPETCHIFLGYQPFNEVLKITRVEKE